MKIMCVGEWKPETTIEGVGGKFLDEGVLMPESGIKDLGRWHDIAGKRVFTLVETEDTAVLHAWLSLWAEYFNWSVYPVLEDDECGAVISNLLGR